MRTTFLAACCAAGHLMFGSPAGAVPIDLGDDYGTFLGTWSGNPQSYCGGMVGAGDCLEGLLSDKYDIEPFDSLGTGINQLNSAGKIDNPPGTDARLTITTNQDNFGGTWDYLTLAEAQAFDPALTPPPGDEAVDLYLVPKYGPAFSVFYLGAIDPDEADSDGLWSVDPDVLGLPDCTAAFVMAQGDAGAGCIPVNENGQPFAISNIEGFWPPLLLADIPEPATLGLLGMGLMGLGAIGAARRRRCA